MLNHFIEVAQNPEDKEHVWVVIHTGSRNLGIKVHGYWKTLVKKGRVDKEAIKKEEQQIKKAHAGYGSEIKNKIEALHKSGKHTIPPSRFLMYKSDLQGYIEDVFTLKAWAEYNRFLILERIKGCSKGWLGKEVERVESVHNYLDPIDKVMRKGAIKADKDQSLIIPISMQFGSIIGKGLGNSEWNNSAPHGAGRVMSREKAKNNITMKEFEEAMKGITSSAIVPQCLDEAPQAYKNPDFILSQISGQTVEVVEIIKPLLNLKNTGLKD